jgi:hypothetical protein
MFSWFPLFIPLSSPVRVSKDSEIIVHVWRSYLCIFSGDCNNFFLPLGAKMQKKFGTSGVLPTAMLSLQFKIATARVFQSDYKAFSDAVCSKLNEPVINCFVYIRRFI